MGKSTECSGLVLKHNYNMLWVSLVTCSIVHLQLQMVQATRDGLDQKYQTLTGRLKDFEGQLKQLITRKTAISGDEVCAEEGEEKEDNTIPWLNPPRGTLQASLDYAKQLSEKAYSSLGSVTVASRFLPGNLKENAGLAYQRAQDMYSTLKPVR